jgi:ankyrin repeat protein
MSAETANELHGLHRAIKRGDVLAVRQYLRAGGSVTAKDQYGWTPLLMAAKQGHTPIVRLLVEAGADINEVWPYGYTALAAAAFAGSAETVAYLLDRGADPDPNPGGGHPLRQWMRVYGDRRAKILELIDAAIERGRCPRA